MHTYRTLPAVASLVAPWQRCASTLSASKVIPARALMAAASRPACDTASIHINQHLYHYTCHTSSGCLIYVNYHSNYFSNIFIPQTRYIHIE